MTVIIIGLAIVFTAFTIAWQYDRWERRRTSKAQIARLGIYKAHR